MNPRGSAVPAVRVSVIIPVLNTERYLREAIDSTLAQTLPPAEVLVVDDGSCDGSVALARAYGGTVSVIEGPHGGIGATRNAGAARAVGNFLAFLDADDYWVPEKLAWQVDALAQVPDGEAVFGRLRQFYSPEVAVADEERARVSQAIYEGQHAGTLLIRRESFERIGPFNPAVRVGEFLDWYARATEAGLRMTVVPQVVMFRRIHDRNTVTRLRSAQTDYTKILKAALDRRRAGGSPGTVADRA